MWTRYWGRSLVRNQNNPFPDNLNDRFILKANFQYLSCKLPLNVRGITTKLHLTVLGQHPFCASVFRLRMNRLTQPSLGSETNF